MPTSWSASLTRWPRPCQLYANRKHHYRRIGPIFAGSAPSSMRDIFSRHDQPFFNQADLVTIEPLSLPAVHDIVTDGFLTTARKPGRVSSLIYQLTAGHPQRTMRAADEVWRLGSSPTGRRPRPATSPPSPG